MTTNLDEKLRVKPIIPDHELIRCIGSGSYGEVWLARNVMGNYRAVKVVYRKTFENDRPFEREFNGIQKFEPISRSDNCQVDILHIGRNEDYFYYVMELADDQTRGQQIDPETYVARILSNELKQRGRLPFEECLEIGLALTAALDHLHQNGLVHRDVKPSNVIFVNGIPKLADIGLVTDVAATMSFVGTEGFLPPEGPGTAQADIFSLGKVLYEMSTGKDRKDFPEPPTLLGEFADREELLEFGEVVKRACAADLRERYASAQAMQTDLLLLKTGKSVRQSHRLHRRLKIAMRAGIRAGVIILLAFGVYLFAQNQTRKAQERSRREAASRKPSQETILWRQAFGLFEQNRLPEAEALFRESLELRRKTWGNDHTNTAAALSGLGNSLRLQSKFAEAEPFYRECLAIREKNVPDAWYTFYTRSLLGEMLLRQKKFVEAEPLLLSGYKGMKERENEIRESRKLFRDLITQLIELYEATASGQAADWKKKLAKLETSK